MVDPASTKKRSTPIKAQSLLSHPHLNLAHHAMDIDQLFDKLLEKPILELSGADLRTFHALGITKLRLLCSNRPLPPLYRELVSQATDRRPGAAKTNNTSPVPPEEHDPLSAEAREIDRKIAKRRGPPIAVYTGKLDDWYSIQVKNLGPGLAYDLDKYNYYPHGGSQLQNGYFYVLPEDLKDFLRLLKKSGGVLG
jgi:hypothetical protein